VALAVSTLAHSSESGSRGPAGRKPEVATCVYTCLLNGYEDLNEQPVSSESAVDFICFTDDSDLVSDSWSLRPVKPLFGADPARSQRHIKICADRVLAEYDVSLYIDNSVILTQPPEVLIEALLPDDGKLALFEHSFRETVRDEFSEVVKLGLDAETVCREQEEHYDSVDADSLDEKPLWSGLLLRRHNDPRVIEAMNTWHAHVLRYSHRDQLSIGYALRSTGVTPSVHSLDIFESPFHRWPVISRRDRDRAGMSAVRSLERTLADERAERVRMELELQALRATRSWRWTAPFRIARRGPVDRRRRGDAL
jgi:hypothetical protein